MNLWNNGGSIDLDGEGINGFTFKFRDAGQALVGTVTGNAADTLQQQTFGFTAVNGVASVDLVILSNHEPAIRPHALFHEINFEGFMARNAVPNLGTWDMVLLAVLVTGSASIMVGKSHVAQSY